MSFSKPPVPGRTPSYLISLPTSTAASVRRSGRWKLYSRKNRKRITMNQVRINALRLLAASLLLCCYFGAPVPAQEPKPAPTLPPGMKGADASDPRANLSAGLFDAGETSLGIRHVQLLRKPDAFQLGVDPNSPKVEKALTALGVGNPAQIPAQIKMTFAGLAFANSDLAFQGNNLFLGNFYGMNIYDISDPAKAK